MDVLTSEQRSRNMRAIKAKGTKIENVLSKALWNRGYRFRRNDKTIYGKPDISIKKYKIAVFCDSEFWHGKDWGKQKHRIGTNQEFWINKIGRNIARDKDVNAFLTSNDWKVLRFWGDDIRKSLDQCVDSIVKVIEEKKKVC